MNIRCAMRDLQAGMILSKAIYAADGRVLVEEGTVLTDYLIQNLRERALVSVMIQRPEHLAVYVEKTAPPETKTAPPVISEPVAAPDRSLPPVLLPPAAVKANPEQDILLDMAYVDCYMDVMRRMQAIFAQRGNLAEVNMEAVQALIASGEVLKLCDGVKAVTQIHNMLREGDYLIHHSLHVAILAGLMGSWLKWPSQRKRKLILAGLLHDAGKLRVSKDILDKPGRLSNTELRIVQRHAQSGYDMLCQGPLAGEAEVLFGILQHHERNDGSGYPHQLKKEQISDFGRILAILDIYDAMAANRSYARRSSPFDVFSVLSENIMQKKLDAEYGLLFIRKVCHSLNGSWVRLSNGKKAKIVYIDDSRMNALPVVQTDEGEFMDLNARHDVRVSVLLTYQEAVSLTKG